jgi:hypothetical protein
MQKWLSRIDFRLVFRLSLSLAMGVTGYVQNDYVVGIFGLFFAIYAIVGAKYKIGCGYNACGYTPRYTSKYAQKENISPIDFKEIK